MSHQKLAEEHEVLAFNLAETPGHLLRRCHQRSREVFNERLGEFGISRQLLSVLVTIFQNPGLTYVVLAEMSGFDRNTLAEMIERLVTRELVVRQKSEQDARAYSVALTEPGKHLVKQMIPLAEQVQDDILKPIPEDLRPVFIECMQRMIGLDK